VLEIRPKRQSSYLYAAQGRQGAPPDVIYPFNFHPAVSLRFPIGTAEKASMGDQETMQKISERAKEGGASGKVQLRLAAGGHGTPGIQTRGKLSSGGNRKGFKVIVKEVEL